ncbi:NAD-dependent epimerase/dehydratase family protein [Actinomycetospora cinnamomea]|uniref:UDP-glucose 4-epimerase n=1 Tax=Actinomycetospora cinnamomea TaxID=663609 RepID=A0A2U1FA20_9PSEU|nr:NAD-dependent epimerase/dehydratase family protein [Actinomycetospora cinnamomea]PVZ09016.1 UDP-glucose 4-epimerase [Actinomycetospora cinnamomea]
MRVAVTGAGGFVGRAVVSALVAAGHEVVGLVRSHPAAGMRIADLDRPASLADALAGVDGVCHLGAVVRVRASLTDPLGTWRTNLGGTLAVLEALPRGTRLVLASTAAVGDGLPDHPYGSSKLAAEWAVRDAAPARGLGAVVLRLANVAGPGDADPTRLVPAILGAALEGTEFTVNGDGSAVRDLVHVADVAEAFVAALGAAEPGRHRTLPIGSGRPVAVRDVIAAAERATGRPVAVRHREAAPEPQAVVVDPVPARDELGWVPRRSAIDRIVGDAWAERAAAQQW